MARTPQEMPQFNHYANKIRAAKAHLATVKAEFEAGEAQRRAAYTATATAQLAAAVQEFHGLGANVATLCRAYDTKDRATIMRLIGTFKAPSTFEPVPEPAEEPEVLPEYEITDSMPSHFQVTETATGHAVAFDVQISPARITGVSTPSAVALKKAIKADVNHPVRALLPLPLAD